MSDDLPGPDRYARMDLRDGARRRLGLVRAGADGWALDPPDGESLAEALLALCDRVDALEIASQGLRRYEDLYCDALDTIAEFQEATGLEVGGDPGGVTPTHLATEVRRLWSWARLWHRTARRYHEIAQLAQAMLRDSSSRIAELESLLAGDLSPAE